MKLKNTIIALSLAFAGSSAFGALSYNQDFEGLDQTSGSALADNGWLVGANVFDSSGTTFLYNYFTFPAPNGGPAFSSIAIGEGGPDQGAQQLTVYNDYNNGDHANGNRIEALVFQEATVTAAEAGQEITFSFDAKQGDIGGATTAEAFIKVLQSSDGSFAELAIDTFDTTSLGTLWTGETLSLTIDPAWEGELLQFGFASTASNFDASGVLYDNIVVAAIPEPNTAALGLLALSGLWVTRRRK